jgi:phage-related protein
MARYNSGFKYNSSYLYNARIQYVTVGGTVTASGSAFRAASFVKQLISSIAVSGGIFKRKHGTVGNAQASVSSKINKVIHKSVSNGATHIACAITKDIAKVISISINILGVSYTVSHFFRSFYGNIAPSKSLLKLFGKNIEASANISSNIRKIGSFYRGIVKSITPSASIQRVSSFFRFLTGESSISSMLTASASFFRALSNGTVTSASNISKSISKFIFDAVIISRDVVEFVGNGAVAISSKLRRIKYHYFVTLDGILEPLGIKVLRDSYVDIIPPTRDNTEEIPGRNGELDFGAELKSRLIEFHVVTDEMIPEEREELMMQYTKHIISNETKTLVFESDMEKAYEIKYAGKIDPTLYQYQTEFVIPFKMVQPLIEGSYEKELIGNGTIANEGNFETPMIIEVKGFSMYPSITIGDTLLEYAGNIEAGQTLIIDTEKQTAMIGSTNVLAYYNGEFPLLQPGSVNVTADNNVAIRWKDKYL